MKVVIIEDERPAIENLLLELRLIEPSAEVAAILDSVAESTEWFNKNPQPDIVFMDIQLSDGLSFSIFNNCTITCPVIFISAYDKYLVDAFRFNSIDYLLKPVINSELATAIKKYKNLEYHFSKNYGSVLEYLNTREKKKSRIIVKKGIEFQMIKMEDVAYFFTEHKIVFLVDKDNKKYITEKNNLTELEEELDKKYFYRANRKYIINAAFIKRFKPFERSKIIVELSLLLAEEITVSQENTPQFKKWINEI
ncbi:MAG TPA: LytTR family DNA-binding domain-containing protein [Panacibacter sp.]|nr:LytTR family DNA-binding domain-containing protein [Panacibacter sp.]